MKTIRRAGKRWREGAPDHIVDIFDHPEYIDRYTIITTDRYDHNGDTYVSVLGTSESMGFSGWREMKSHEVAQLRYKWGHRRIRWADLPEAIRNYLTTYNEGNN